MATIAELKIIVDSSQVEKAKKDLASLGEAATKVGASTKGFSDGMKNASGSSEEFSGAAQRLIDKATKLESTIGATKGGILNYDAALLGVTRVVKPLATSIDALTAAQKNQDAVTKEVSRSQSLLDSERHKMIQSLKEEVELYGKSRQEKLLYRAEQLGIIDSVRPLVEELKNLAEAHEKADRAGRSGADERISKKQQELEALKLEGAELQKNSALIGEKANAEARIAEQQKAVEANRVKYENKQQEIAELKGVAEGERLLAEDKKKVTKATEAERDAFVKLQHEIDPLSKSMDNYERQLSEIARLREHATKGRAGFGKHDLKDLDALEAGVNNNIKRMKDLGSTSGKTAKEIAFSMRGLPAQFTDIAVSLQGGQKPLTVFLQQGGQLKDMFGGVGVAAKAMGGYILSLLTPLNMILASIAGLGFLAYKGYNEMYELNKALTLSGKSAAISSKDIKGYISAVSDIKGTSSEAIGVITTLIASTNIHKDSIVDASAATLAWSSATGDSIENILADFNSLTKDPVKSVVTLSEKYKFLTTELYNNIRALKEAGDEMGATKLATQALSESLIGQELVLKHTRSAWGDLVSYLGGGVKTLISGFSTLFGLNKDDLKILEDKKKIYQDMADTQRQRLIEDPTNKIAANFLREYLGNVSELDVAIQALLSTQQAAADAPVNKALDALSTHYNSSAGGVYKAEKAFKDYMNTVRKAFDTTTGEFLGTSEQFKQYEENRAKLLRDVQDAYKVATGKELLEQAENNNLALKESAGLVGKVGSETKKLVLLMKELSELEDKSSKGEWLTDAEKGKLANKDRLIALQKENILIEKSAAKAKKTSVVRDDAATKLLLSLKEQEAVLKEQLETDSKLGKQAQEFAKMDAMFSELKEKATKTKLTLGQQSLLNNESEIRAQRTILVDLEAQNRAKADGVKIDAYRANLASKLQEDASKKSVIGETRGVSDKEVSRIKERNDLLKEKNDLDREAAAGLRDTGNVNVYTKQIEANEEFYKKRKANLVDYYETEDKAQQDWHGGMQAGFANFIESQADMYSSMSELTQNTLSTLADGVSESLTQAILYGEDLRISLTNLAMTITEQLLKGLIDVGIQFAINAAKEAAGVATVGAAKQAVITGTAAVADAATIKTAGVQSAAGASTAAAWSPAALAASIGSFGAAAAIGLAAVVAMMAAFGGFRKGGYTGNMGVDDVAGVVHGKEYVFDAAATSRIGINNLESLRSGGGISPDFTSSGSSSGGGRSGGIVNQTINVQGTVDRQTANQIARRSAQKQSIAEARLG